MDEIREFTEPVIVNGVFTLLASNMKGFAFEFAYSRPVWTGSNQLTSRIRSESLVKALCGRMFVEKTTSLNLTI